MDDSQMVKPDQHPILLHFKNEDLEQEFVRSYDLSLRSHLRAGYVQSLFIWLLAIAVVYLVIPEHFVRITSVIIIGFFPYLGFAFYATGKDRFAGTYEALGAVANAIAGLMAIYFFSFLPNGEYFVAMALISTMFFGFYINRLRFVYGTAAALIYVVGFQVYLFAQPDSVIAQPMILSIWLWATLLLAVTAGHFAESTQRTLFVQSKVIRSQKITIRKEQERSASLVEQVRILEIEIDRTKQEKQVADITENEYFRSLQDRAATMRQNRGRGREGRSSA